MSQIQSKFNELLARQPLSYILIFLTALLFYIYCLCPTIGFGDTAILIDNIQRSVINTEVNTHPFTVILGKIFLSIPFENLAYRANLLSAFTGALALSIFFRAVQEYHGNVLTSVLSTLVLAVSYSFFWHSTIVENYNISSIITALSILYYVRIAKTNEEKWFYPLFALFGLGIFNHVQMGFLGMGIGIQFLLQIGKVKNKLNFFVKCGIGFVLGLIPWTYLLIKEILSSHNASLVIKNAFMGSFGNIFFSQTLKVAIQEFLVIYWFQFPNLFLIFPIVGLVLLLKNKTTTLQFSGTLIHFLTNTIFFAFYGTWDKFAFLLQSFILVVFYGSFFLQILQSKSRIIALITNILLFSSTLYGMGFYETVHKSGQDPYGTWYGRYNNEYSANLYDQAEYVIVLNKRNYREVEKYCELIFEKLPQGATMLEDDSRTYYPLADYFQKYYDKRKDIHFLLMNSWGIAGWGLSSEQVASEIKKSVEKGEAFFIPTLSTPYGSIIETISRDGTMYFDKFPLSSTQWIYQVKSRNELSQKSQSKEGFWDLQMKHVSSSSKNVFLSRQFMNSFQGNWDGEDQIFLSGENGSYAEWKLAHTKTETAKIQIHLTSAPDFGTLNIYWNQKKILANIDSYALSVGRFTSPVVAVDLRSGDNLLRVELSGKNPESSGFKFGVDSVEIVKK